MHNIKSSGWKNCQVAIGNQIYAGPTHKELQESIMLNEAISCYEKDWDLLLLKQELKNLERERLHLEHKQKERSLTEWEIRRSTQILDEVMGILSKLSSHKFSKNHDSSPHV